MALFQTSVLKKHLQLQDPSSIEKAYKKFIKYFHNPKIQQNIRSSKEEEYQGIFLTELFSNILGYTMKPNANYNLVAEFKNEKNSKKADGAILKDGQALGVIELKGTNTKDLEKVRQQAFDYKANQTGCVYVITSNFEKLRFYIENAVDYEEFNLFQLSKEQFELLYLCLQKDNLLNNQALQLKKDSVVEEEGITKTFYADYSLFKRELYRDLVKQNMKNEVFRSQLEREDSERATKNIKLSLFKKSQKLIDRFLFIFFAEDRGLLPPNSTLQILNKWRDDQDFGDERPLYNLFKTYFNFLDTGRKGTPNRAEIFAYNGGLFKPDPVLDAMAIDDELLFRHTKKLSDYDFDSQVDVNILGHIFENSLNEIESVNAEIEGTNFDKQKTKRKKDGVFYTPKYITKYIVDNTVGKLCEEKKTALNIVEEEFTPNRQTATKKKLLANLEEYRNWLLSLTICDPACGSGAFLNQALDFLIKEHHFLDELQTKLTGTSIVFPNIENRVLENNIYGVDINEESVEIAQLSLWLRTAQPRRKLTSLTNNIKCGNSLIDQKSVAGDKAFTWQEEFPEVFANGGFDVVIGNPPYVSRGITNDLKEHLKSKFSTAQYQFELYVSFIEKSTALTKNDRFISFIVPNSWLKNLMMSDLRKFILDNINIHTLIPNLDNVFEGASVDTMIFIGQKNNKKAITTIGQFTEADFKYKHSVKQERFITNEKYIFDVEVNESVLPIIKKMKKDVVFVGDILDVIRGINPYDKYTGQSPEVISQRAYHADYKKDDSFVPELKGLHTSRYLYQWDEKHFISYGDWLAAQRPLKYFEGERIVFREILGKTLVSTLITEDFKIDRSLYIARIEEEKSDLYSIKYVLGILNSKLLAFFFRYSNNEFDALFPKIRVAEFKKLPIRIQPKAEQFDLDNLVQEMLSSTKEYNLLLKKFTNYLSSQLSLEKLSKKLHNWQDLDFKTFITELNKAIKKAGREKLSKCEEMDWMELFEIKKEQALALKAEIDKTDREIDQMVYELYDLTAEEIAIVEESTGGTKAGETSTATSADQKIMDELAEKSKKKTTA